MFFYLMSGVQWSNLPACMPACLPACLPISLPIYLPSGLPHTTLCYIADHFFCTPPTCPATMCFAARGWLQLMVARRSSSRRRWGTRCVVNQWMPGNDVL